MGKRKFGRGSKGNIPLIETIGLIAEIVSIFTAPTKDYGTVASQLQAGNWVNAGMAFQQSVTTLKTHTPLLLVGGAVAARKAIGSVKIIRGVSLW